METTTSILRTAATQMGIEDTGDVVRDIRAAYEAAGPWPQAQEHRWPTSEESAQHAKLRPLWELWAAVRVASHVTPEVVAHHVSMATTPRVSAPAAELRRTYPERWANVCRYFDDDRETAIRLGLTLSFERLQDEERRLLALMS